MLSLRTKWSKITNTPINKIHPAQKYDELLEYEDIDDPAQWKLRECDRADSADWMPCIVEEKSTHVLVYYVNVNEHSAYHTASLLLIIQPTCAWLELWKDFRLLDRTPASVLTSGEPPPDIVQLAAAMHGEVAGYEPPAGLTINGKKVLGVKK